MIAFIISAGTLIGVAAVVYAVTLARLRAYHRQFP